MKNFKKTKGIVKTVSDMYYTLMVDGELITITKSIMHRYVNFPDILLSGDNLRIGSEICLTRIQDEESVVYYPDHSVYCIKDNNPINLMDGLEDFTPFADFDTCLERLSQKIPNMESEERFRTLKLLEKAQSSETREELMKMFGDDSNLPNECESIEYKSSITHCAHGSKYANLNHGQLIEIVMSVAAIANTSRKGKLYVGIKDKAKGYMASGIENEIAEKYPRLSLDAYQNTVLSNFIRSYTGSDSLLQGLKFKWFKYQNHLILCIDIDFKGSFVLCNISNKPILPYRVGSSTHSVTGYQMLDYVQTHDNKQK